MVEKKKPVTYIQFAIRVSREDYEKLKARLESEKKATGFDKLSLSDICRKAIKTLID